MIKEEVLIQYKELYQTANIGVELENIVDIEQLQKTPVLINKDSGLAYDGALIYYSLTMWFYAKKLQPIYSSIHNVDLQSLAKIIVLQPLGKIGMYEPNDNEWEVNKLGKIYKFSEKSVCLKSGDYAKILCSNAGVTFTLDEYEAMGVLDKTFEEFEKSRMYLTPLSILFKMCHDFAFDFAKTKYKNTNKNSQ
jgi:hypothetical protein